MHHIINFHNELIEKYGIENATGFSDKSQQIRFSVIRNQISDLRSKILDYGCNKGDFLQFILKRINLPNYTGHDINCNFIEHAKSKYPEYTFACTDAIPLGYQYIIASGIFCYNENEEDHYRILQNMWANTEDTVICNFLNKNNPISKHKLKAYYPSEIAKMVEEIGCRSYSIIGDYLHNDFTLVMRKKWSHANINPPA